MKHAKTKAKRQRTKPLKWRVQSDLTGFDEIVVTTGDPGGCLLHAEMLGGKTIFVSVGPVRLWAHINDKGVATVTMVEDDLERISL